MFTKDGVKTKFLEKYVSVTDLGRDSKTLHDVGAAILLPVSLETQVFSREYGPGPLPNSHKLSAASAVVLVK